MAWTLVIHGGSGSMSPRTLDPVATKAGLAGLTDALTAGQALLEAGGAAIDAVEAAVRVLEDDPAFNAGRGSVFTADGHTECDAAIMDGSDLSAGAVAGLRATRNPVTLAREVMRNSPHVFLAGAKADAFGRAHGIPAAPPEWFETTERRRQLDEILANPNAPFDLGMKYGTVGAVAVDEHGHVASATSTGGLTGKKWGRVGDSPIIGAGTYADDRAGAVSCTGAGEFFIRLAVAHEILARTRLAGVACGIAAQQLVDELDVIGGKGGVIWVDRCGAGGWSFNTPGMYRGRVSSDNQAEVAVFDA